MRTVTLLLLYYGCAFYGFRNPFFGVLFFIHITIFRPEALVWGNLAFGRLHMITAILALTGYFVNSKKSINQNNNVFQNKNITIFILFLISLLLSTAFAVSSVSLSLEKAVELIKIFVLCFLFAKLVNTERGFQVYVWVTCISFGLLSVWGVQQALAGNDRLDTLWPGGSNYIAAQLAMMAPFSLAKVFDTNLASKYKLIFLACTASIILCCIYTDSRGGFLGLSTAMLAFTLRSKQRVRIITSLTLIIIFAYPLAYSWLPENYSNRISSIFAEEKERDMSAESRPVLWKIAFRIWQDYPIVGVGLQNFSPVKDDYSDKVSDIVTSEEMFTHIFGRQRYTHGLYQGMMAETGLVGVSLFLILLLRNIFCRFPRIFVNSFAHQDRLYLQVTAAQAGLIGFAVAAIFGDFQYIEMLYLQLFFVGAVRSYADSLASQPDAEKLLEPL